MVAGEYDEFCISMHLPSSNCTRKMHRPACGNWFYCYCRLKIYCIIFPISYTKTCAKSKGYLKFEITDILDYSYR